VASVQLVGISYCDGLVDCRNLVTDLGGWISQVIRSPRLQLRLALQLDQARDGFFCGRFEMISLLGLSTIESGRNLIFCARVAYQ
jgi:hypothetical protein